MSDRQSNPDPPDWLKEYPAVGMPELSDRDSACLVLSDLDYEAQLAAIHFTLRGHQKVDDELKKEIADIEAFAKETTGIRNQHAVDEWVDRIHRSVYEDAARSMAAVGMLAPMMESVFYQAFQGIRRESEEDQMQQRSHSRWKRPAEDQWDCHYTWSNGRRSTNLVAGILQLADATGLIAHLPQGLEQPLQALFEYRNKMFHHGFEWPVEERARFAKRIGDAGWDSSWFARASQGGEPWVFYMSDVFIQHVVKILDEVITAIGAFCKAQSYASDGTVGTGASGS